MDISEIYSKEAVTISQDAPLIHAAHLMKDVFVADVIVVEAQNPSGEKPVGIITDRDIVVSVIAQGMDIESLKVKDVMKTAFISVNSHAEITDCIRLMTENKSTRMPVLNDDGNVIGVISMSDILNRIQQLLAVSINLIRTN